VVRQACSERDYSTRRDWVPSHAQKRTLKGQNPKGQKEEGFWTRKEERGLEEITDNLWFSRTLFGNISQKTTKKKERRDMKKTRGSRSLSRTINNPLKDLLCPIKPIEKGGSLGKKS